MEKIKRVHFFLVVCVCVHARTHARAKGSLWGVPAPLPDYTLYPFS